MVRRVRSSGILAALVFVLLFADQCRAQVSTEQRILSILEPKLANLQQRMKDALSASTVTAARDERKTNGVNQMTVTITDSVRKQGNDLVKVSDALKKVKVAMERMNKMTESVKKDVAAVNREMDSLHTFAEGMHDTHHELHQKIINIGGKVNDYNQRHHSRFIWYLLFTVELLIVVGLVGYKKMKTEKKFHKLT